MKYYKKFYEVENNKYYILEADDELYVATESFLKIGKKKFSNKYEELVQGFKLLELSAPIAVLFNLILDRKAKDNPISEVCGTKDSKIEYILDRINMLREDFKLKYMYNKSLYQFEK